MKKRRKSNNKRRMVFMILISVVFIAVATLIVVEIFQMRAKNSEMRARKERLEEILSEEELRKELLENEEAYIQTKKYIEEKAKAIGYVYPDEIIFRKDE